MLYTICVIIIQESSKAFFLANVDQALAFATVYDLAEFEDDGSQGVASVAEVQPYARFSERQGKSLHVYLE